MSTDLIPMGELETLLPARYDDKVFNDMAAGSAYLPYLTLGGLNSQLVAEKQIGAGEYGVVSQKKCTRLGEEVDIIPVDWQPMAMRVIDNTVTTVTDPNDIEFKRIMSESEVKDSGCMYGPCFLIYIPKVAKFATYFMSSKTARREAPNLKELMLKGATLKSHLIAPPKSKYKWYGPLVTPCSKALDVPTIDDVKEAALKFREVPPKSDVETVDAPAGGRVV